MLLADEEELGEDSVEVNQVDGLHDVYLPGTRGEEALNGDLHSTGCHVVAVEDAN